MTPEALAELYRKVVLDHARQPRNKIAPTGQSFDHFEANPVCGDEIHFYFDQEDGVFKRVVFQGEGCLLSQASASLLSTYVQNSKGSALREKLEHLKAWLTRAPEDDAPDWEDPAMEAFWQEIHRLKGRQTCALLAWECLAKGAEKAAGNSSG